MYCLFQKKEREEREEREGKMVTIHIIHRVKYLRHADTCGFLHEGNMATESQRVESKSHLRGLAQEIIKGKGIICSLPFHALFQALNTCCLQTAFLGWFPSHLHFPRVSFLFYAEVGIKRIKQMSPFLNSKHLHHIHT